MLLINTIPERVNAGLVNYASVIREYFRLTFHYDYIRPFRILLASPFNRQLHDVIDAVAREDHYDKLHIREIIWNLS